MRKIVTGLLAAAALTAVASGPARADVDVALTDGASWTTFFFADDGSAFQDLDGNTLDFTFTLTSAALLRVTDGYDDGDQFSVTINGVTSATSPGVFDGTYIGTAWNQPFSDPATGALFSHATYDLGPGTYVVTGIVTQSPFFSGAGAIQLGGVVPEPATWAMMLVGFGGLGAVLRRARRTTAALA